MTNNLPFSTVLSLEKQLHEEEVRYNEAFRMDAEFHVLKSIRQKIRHLEAELSEQTAQCSEEETLNATRISCIPN